MICEACERGDHANCGMQTWCECDCERSCSIPMSNLETNYSLDPEAFTQYWPGVDDELPQNLNVITGEVDE